QRLAEPIRKVRRRRVDLVPCIVDDPETVIAAPRQPDLLRLVGVGGLVSRKGPDVALGAVKELSDRGIPAQLTWVGGGALHDELLANAEAWGIADRLQLTGPLTPQGVGEQLDAADLFVLPTLGDNFCIVVAEALVHGRPVVSGSATGAVDYARPEVSEFVDEHSAVAFADAIERVRAKTAGLSAEDVASTVRGAFTSARVADELVAVYRAVGAS
ncbi:MAG: glycosyltransferase family 4 protein, partial [Marmoricola sp.]